MTLTATNILRGRLKKNWRNKRIVYMDIGQKFNEILGRKVK